MKTIILLIFLLLQFNLFSQDASYDIEKEYEQFLFRRKIQVKLATEDKIKHVVIFQKNMKLLVKKKDISEIFYKSKLIDEVYYNNNGENYLGFKLIERVIGKMKVRDKNDKWKIIKYKRYFIHYFMFQENDWKYIKYKKKSIDFDRKEFVGYYFLIDDYEWIENRKIVFCKMIYPVFCRIYIITNRKSRKDKKFINIFDSNDKFLVSLRLLAQFY
jgi:hypothetical protein